ncbi:MAG: DUF3102 domain-containing protein [Pseudomonadota bacterium]|nr:DUF3102 domain-containing protein [Pseudomonadota bacterium]
MKEAVVSTENNSALVVFDFNSIPVQDREHIISITYRLRSLNKSVAESIIEIGNLLIEARRRLPEKKFMTWAEAEFGYSRRSMQRYIAVAEKFHNVPMQNMALPAKILYELVETAPAEVLDSTIERLESGESINADEIRRQIEAAKEEAIKEMDVDVKIQLRKMTEQIKVLEKERDTAHQNIDGLSAKGIEIHTRLQEVSKELERLKNAGKEDEDKVKVLREEAKRLEREKITCSSEIAKLAKQRDELQNDISKQKLDRQRQRALTDKLINYRNKLSEVLAWSQEANLISASGDLSKEMIGEFKSILQVINSHSIQIKAVIDSIEKIK